MALGPYHQSGPGEIVQFEFGISYSSSSQPAFLGLALAAGRIIDLHRHSVRYAQHQAPWQVPVPSAGASLAGSLCYSGIE
ncbi:hypothetical protein V494_07676 [Pseudogymnoascus sp. VKM F-4513 (FW-928)]|nr:hypothetical protein V494_07676 [Pseudogymnoascus sp. VKM F-4513 (FW-928)]